MHVRGLLGAYEMLSALGDSVVFAVLASLPLVTFRGQSVIERYSIVHLAQV